MVDCCNSAVAGYRLLDPAEVTNLEGPPRFFLGQYGSPHTFPLGDAFPWSTGARSKPVALRIGWRCGQFVRLGSMEIVERYVQSHPFQTQLSIGHKVNVTASLGPKADWELPLLVDLWIEGSRSSTAEIEAATDSLESMRKRLDGILKLSPYELEVKQEFLEVKVPRLIYRNFDTTSAKAAIRTHLTGNNRFEEIPSLQAAGTMLKIGPEPCGTVKAVVSFLKQETGEKSKEAVSRTSNRQRWMPFLMAALFLATWALPLRVWSVILVAAIQIVILAIVVIPAFNVGLRVLFRQTAIVATGTLFMIGVFGVAYSCCALTGDKALGHVTHLGYPFLVATSLGVAGGILGDNPTGFARILAHLQLLLFLGGIIAAIVALLRIDRTVRRPG